MRSSPMRVLFCLPFLLGVVLAPVGSAAAPAPAGTAAGTAARVAAGGGLTVSDSRIYAGDPVTFRGWLIRGEMNQKALLQVRRNGAWRKIGYDYTNRRGRFALAEHLDYPTGTHTFRVLGKAKPSYGLPQVVTRTVKVVVEPRPGSKELPWRPGQQFTLGHWRLVYGVTDTDAWPELQAEGAKQPPAPGWSYVSVPLTATRTGTNSGKVYIETDIDFVGGDGVVYSSSYVEMNGTYYSCSRHNDWSDAPELFPGASATMSRCLMVPTNAIAGGMWRTDDYVTEQFITQN